MEYKLKAFIYGIGASILGLIAIATFLQTGFGVVVSLFWFALCFIFVWYAFKAIKYKGKGR